jgi:hypothetical protein
LLHLSFLGFDNEPNWNHDMESHLLVPSEADFEGLNDDSETENEDESSDSDPEGDLKDDGQTSGNAFRSMRLVHIFMVNWESEFMLFQICVLLSLLNF